ncbi:hypothetical protein DMUE_2190 [Dictyocoela muelleri]|nr:hypothetical protein DMUE_2190 [Dictyocoela muelleri]
MIFLNIFFIFAVIFQNNSDAAILNLIYQSKNFVNYTNEFINRGLNSMKFEISEIEKIRYFDEYYFKIGLIFDDINNFNSKISPIKCKYKITNKRILMPFFSYAEECRLHIKNLLLQQFFTKIKSSNCDKILIYKLKSHIEHSGLLLNEFLSKMKVKNGDIYYKNQYFFTELSELGESFEIQLKYIKILPKNNLSIMNAFKSFFYFADVISILTNCEEDSELTPIFKSKDLAQLKTNLKELRLKIYNVLFSNFVQDYPIEISAFKSKEALLWLIYTTSLSGINFFYLTFEYTLNGNIQKSKNKNYQIPRDEIKILLNFDYQKRLSNIFAEELLIIQNINKLLEPVNQFGNNIDLIDYSDSIEIINCKTVYENYIWCLEFMTIIHQECVKFFRKEGQEEIYLTKNDFYQLKKFMKLVNIQIRSILVSFQYLNQAYDIYRSRNCVREKYLLLKNEFINIYDTLNESIGFLN